MATITGTTHHDTLTGTTGDDLFIPYGVTGSESPDYMKGGDGNDVYDLRKPVGVDPVHKYIIDDKGLDGGIDSILGAGALIATASFGYLSYVTAIRVGDDLRIITPLKPYRFHDPEVPSFDITIIDHFGGAAVETLQAGGVTYALAATGTGSAMADIVAGTDGADTLLGLEGDDFIFGNAGKDTIDGGAGADTIFAGSGRNTVHGGTGNDLIYGGDKTEKLFGDSGNDVIYASAGNDKVKGGSGDDFLYGQDGNDRLVGGNGNDQLIGGLGNDKLIGGKGSDIYRFSYDETTGGPLANPGHDIIKDNGDATASLDILSINGMTSSAATLAGTFARIDIARSGLDMVLDFDNGNSSVTVQNQFKGAKWTIEQVTFSAFSVTGLTFRILNGLTDDIGDDRSGVTAYNEIIFGTDGDDIIFADSGINMIWLGAGADTLIYKESDNSLIPSHGGGDVTDIIQDFDLAEDTFDFTEIVGMTFADLAITNDAQGDAVITWQSNDPEVSDIEIELRNIDALDLTIDHFLFG